ncbi:Rv1679 family acyl-CoA dehydrogenase [Phytoactinopolyspora halotolerans]|uniref:Acyl-CoA/acyl-ACP dehydrogenase n=1 Tax=Phytoactinopolyspora halotolerans TaxID=1981512 RepID=A0A6L9S2J5_9ACTN|nr:acyl-CoA dehydrogenase family protein [Phytoactinopolyspora halotolerans]NED99276.1 acyl-CoA/acyl-ACP dehydrogenase [Phytoactinopolyspora halotolerans]
MNLTHEHLTDALAPVLDAARAAAPDVDADSRFPHEAVTALRESGLLGLTLPADIGGMGGGPVEAARALAEVASVCGSTAMVYLMHLSAAMTTAAAAPPGHPKLLEELADGTTLGTLAFSEPGSRSHFWAPTSQARPASSGDPGKGGTNAVTLDAKKSFVTSAGHADVYVVSTLATGDAGAASPAVDLYAVPGGRDGVTVAGAWRGLGLRGNASAPMTFQLDVTDDDRIGAPGGGFQLMLDAVMPWFNLGNAAVSAGLSQAAVGAAVTHASGSTLEHTGQSLAQLPTIRAQLAKMSLDVAAARSYIDLTARSLAAPGDETMLHVLGVKAFANDTALRVTDAAMRVCGGAAFSNRLQLERFFRDARAGHVMAPTADVLYDFYGKAITGQPVFG